MQKAVVAAFCGALGVSQPAWAQKSPLLGAWEGERGRGFVFFEDGKALLQEGDTRCLADWSVADSVLRFRTDAACGGEEERFRVQSVSDKALVLRVERESDEPILLTLTAAKRPSNPRVDTTRLRERLEGAWEIRHGAGNVHTPDEGRIGLILGVDSFRLLDGSAIAGRWRLFQQSYVVLQIADEPLVSIVGAFPGQLVLPIEVDESGKNWVLPMESVRLTKRIPDPKSAGFDTRAHLVNRWVAKLPEKGMSAWYVFRADGSYSSGIDKNKKTLQTREGRWVYVPDNYLFMENGEGGSDLIRLDWQSRISFAHDKLIFKLDKK